MPEVSVVIPLHNKGAYVSDTLKSLKLQTFKSWEAIIVENNSNDSGPEVAERIAKENFQFKYFDASETVFGPGGARNFGLQLAKGDWILFLDADDLIAPNHLSSLVSLGKEERANNPDLVVSNWVEFVNGKWDWDGETILSEETLFELEAHSASGSELPPPRVGVQDSAIAFAPWAVHCGLIRRESLLAADRQWIVSLDRYPSEDTAFWFRALSGRRVEYTRRATALYRTETLGFRNTYTDIARWAEAIERVHEENLKFLKATGTNISFKQAESLARVWESIGVRARARNLEDLARNAFRKADAWLKVCPFFSSPLSIIGRKLLGVERFISIRS